MPVHPRKVALTVRAPVNESTTQSTPDQRQSMTGALALEFQGRNRLCAIPVRAGESVAAERKCASKCASSWRKVRSISAGAKFLQRWVK